MTRRNLPLFITDRDHNVTYMSSQFRSELDVSLEQVIAGFNCGDAVVGELEPLPAPGTGLQARHYNVRSGDGIIRRYVVYCREMVFNGKSYGFIGSAVRANLCAECLKPKPIRDTDQFHPTPRVSFDTAGAMMEAVQAYIRKLGPMLSFDDANKIYDIGAFRKEMSELQSLGLTTDLTSAESDFFSLLQPCKDFNFQLVEEKAAIGRICALCFTKGFYDVVHNEAVLWLHKHGLAMAVADLAKSSIQEKIRRHHVDVHMETEPEVWIEALFSGVPCFLLDRPWNTFLKTPWRVYSVEAMLESCGIEPDTTLCPYDPAMFADLRIDDIA